MANVPERFLRAVALLDIQPQDHMLEIGCGTGILAELMAAKLEDGTLTAVDRSPAAITNARKRNPDVKFTIAAFAATHFPPASFDKVVAFNVGFFKKGMDKEARLLHRILKPDGKLFVFYDAPYRLTAEAARPIAHLLETHGFRILKSSVEEAPPTGFICVIAQIPH